MNIIKYPAREEWAQIVGRPHLDVTQLNQTVAAVLADADEQKIVDAILSAMRETETGIDEALARFIANKIAISNKDMTVEEIQDLVENYLMSSDRKDVAKQYILYRAERTRKRQMGSDIVRQVWEKTNASNVVNSNANVDEHSFGGRKNEAASAIQKIIALDYNMSPDISAAHWQVRRFRYRHQHCSCLFCRRSRNNH